MQTFKIKSSRFKEIKKYKTLFIIICIMLPVVTLRAQNNDNDHWEAYMASYDKGPCSTLVNFSLHNKAPIKGYPFVVITGVTFKNCTTDGLPVDDELTKLNIISDSVQACLSSVTKTINAGTFTYQCQRLDYVYVPDTLHITELLENLYKKYFPKYEPYIHVRPDANWDAYLTFLYPNEETMEEIDNMKVLMKLQEAGDKLEKARMVDHWLYFKTSVDRENFIPYAKSAGFSINEKMISKGDLIYGLHISRIDKVNLGSIDKITLELRRQAKKYNGDYDGWESVVVKE